MRFHNQLVNSQSFDSRRLKSTSVLLIFFSFDIVHLVVYVSIKFRIYFILIYIRCMCKSSAAILFTVWALT